LSSQTNHTNRVVDGGKEAVDPPTLHSDGDNDGDGDGDGESDGDGDGDGDAPRLSARV